MSLLHNLEKIKKISLVIPIYNEEQSLPLLLKRTLNICQKLKLSYELILVDDGSTDNSTQLMINAAQNPKNNIITVILNRNYGQHCAIIAGFQQINGDIVITIDGDLQNPPEEIPYLIKIAQQGYDIVGTKRINRQDSWFRKTASKIMNKLIIKITGHTMEDYGCMLRVYRRHIIKMILESNKYNIFIPILANTFTKRTIEINVTHAEREFGTSKYNLIKLIKLMFSLLICLKKKPLHLLKIINIIIIIMEVLLTLIFIKLNFIFNKTWNIESIFILLVVLFIFICIQIIILNYINKYFNKINNNNIYTKPHCFINKIINVNKNINKN